MAIIEHAYANGLAVPKPPKARTGKRIAVIGSGPVSSFIYCHKMTSLV